jgi:hypothetical protein
MTRFELHHYFAYNRSSRLYSEATKIYIRPFRHVILRSEHVRTSTLFNPSLRGRTSVKYEIRRGKPFDRTVLIRFSPFRRHPVPKICRLLSVLSLSPPSIHYLSRLLF